MNKIIQTSVFSICITLLCGLSMAHASPSDMRQLAVESLSLYGQQLYNRGDFNESANVYARVIAISPDNGEAMTYLKALRNKGVDLGESILAQIQSVKTSGMTPHAIKPTNQVKTANPISYMKVEAKQEWAVKQEMMNSQAKKIESMPKMNVNAKPLVSDSKVDLIADEIRLRKESGHFTASTEEVANNLKAYQTGVVQPTVVVSKAEVAPVAVARDNSLDNDLVELQSNLKDLRQSLQSKTEQLKNLEKQLQ